MVQNWAVVRHSGTGFAVAAFRDEGSAQDWVDCHFADGVISVECVSFEETKLNGARMIG